MPRQPKSQDTHCPAAALRRELGLAAVTIARRLELSVKKVTQCLRAMPDYDWCDHVQIAVITEAFVRQEEAIALAAAPSSAHRAAIERRMEERLRDVGGYALACAGCDALGPVPFVMIRKELESKRPTEAGLLPFAERDIDHKWVQVAIKDEPDAFELAEEVGFRDHGGMVWCPGCLGHIDQIMRARETRLNELNEE